jgi:hypothetical protein
MRPRYFWLFCLCFVLAGCVSPGGNPSQQADEALEPRLLEPLHFAEFSVVGTITPKGLEQLSREKLRSSQPDAYEFLAHPETGRYIRTETVEQYLKALSAGYRTRTTSDITTESFFKQAANVLQFMKKAQTARHNDMAGVSLKNLSVGFLGWSGSEEQEALERDVTRGTRLADYAISGRIKHLQIKNGGLKFDYKNRHYIVDKVALGDITGDGHMELLVSIAWYYHEGSGRSYDLNVVARSENRLKFLLVNAL